MKKNRIRVTEQDLHNIIKESVKKVLKEGGDYYSHNDSTRRTVQNLDDDDDIDYESHDGQTHEQVKRVHDYLEELLGEVHESIDRLHMELSDMNLMDECNKIYKLECAINDIVRNINLYKVLKNGGELPYWSSEEAQSF